MRDGWKEISLGQLTENTRPICYGVLKPGPQVDGGVPLIKITDMDRRILGPEGMQGISKELDEEFRRSRLLGGEVLLSIQGTIGRVAIAASTLKGANISRTIAVIDPDDRLLNLYLVYVLEKIATQGDFDSAGSTRESLNISTIRGMKIWCPPIAEQRRIVDLISSVDSYIEALQNQLESAKRSRNAVLHELLTAGGDEWVETTLGQEFEICKNGKNYKDGISTEGLPISRIQTIASGKIDLTKVGFGNLFVDDAEGFLLEEGDILFSHINSLPHVGKVALVQHNHLPLIHGMNLLRMRFTNLSDTNFMFYLMQSELMRDEIKSRAQVAVNQVSINISSIKTIKIVIPPLKIQKEIATLIGAWDNLIEECENNLDSSRSLRAGLLSELLGGEHEIPSNYDKVTGAA